MRRGDSMDAVFKAMVHLGAALFLGGGTYARWIGPESLDGRAPARLRLGVIIGGILLCVGSVLDVHRALGDVPLSEFWEYMTLSRHGQSVLMRLALVAALALAGAPAARVSRPGRAIYGALGVALLGTISLVSHTGVHAGTPGIIADLAHQIAGVVWGGSLLYLAVAPVWPPVREPSEPLVRALRRISRVGLVSVLVLVASGIYAARVHLSGLAALTGSAYGRTLIVKLALVGVTLAVAGANRWVFLPRVERTGASAGMARMIRIEAALLVAVFLVTGVLTTQAPPHE